MNIEKLKIDLQEINDRVRLPPYLHAIVFKIMDGNITSLEVDKILFDFKTNHAIAKVDFLHLIFEFIHLSLHDDLLSTDEKEIIGYLKRIFKISSGDFLLHTNEEVDNVITYQLSRMYSDNLITHDEALLKDDLQELFDLSFDQMNDYSKLEAAISLKQGADIENLDVFFTHSEYFDLKNWI